MTLAVGFIGVGNMASALVKAVHQSDLDVAIYLSDHYPDKIKDFAREVDGQIVASTEEILAKSDVIFVGTKPKDVPGVFADLAQALASSEGKLWISMAAGVPLAKLEGLTPSGRGHQWIRIMPNTPAHYGQGAIAYCPGQETSQESVETFCGLLNAAGYVAPFTEDQFDAITAVSGSGPAFVYIMIEAMSDAAVSQGIPRDKAIHLAAQTVLGSALTVLESGDHPAVLKDRVTSPAGTTIAGVKALDANGFRQALHEAIDAATEVSRQLGK
ncbi:pyrroline-5-carboxylate reductase [Hutsoniella sourekii]|uniref:pyrroline-5-carboxylate reductase n=1 Tax=Hutsoniella sourekii TaxID=87650 RepID=UPI0004825AF9|nr:pyrroline-5-carboxylate reductase [Hutsoniella sourekii]